MKKIIYSLIAVLAFAFASCEKEEPGGTATQDVAGEWYVTIVAVSNNSDTLTGDDLLYIGAQMGYELWNEGVEKGIIRTFNTAANVPDKMFISDMSTFGGGQKGYSNFSPYLCFNVPVTVNQADGTFATEGNDFVKNLEVLYDWNDEDYTEEEMYYSIKILNGKIVKNGGKQNNGSPDDSIEFDIYMQGDGLTADLTPILAEFNVDFTFDHYHVSGVRYSGLAENN